MGVRRWSTAHWRAATLVAIHLVIAVHVVWWIWSGRTVAPAELNESMYTLEHGVVTVGFLFMALIVLSVAFFGRFFCSWGCHVLALQDLAAWLLARVGVRPKPVRLRFLLLVPLGAALSMFLWPQVTRLMAGSAWGPLRVSTDAEGFGSLVTEDFLRNLPSVPVAAMTFLICGGVMVYLLGSRSFCTYVCPYGAVFSLVDRLALGRIHLVGSTSQCAECARCTAVCTSHIRVHDEVARFGRVVSPACLKDLDCIDACPTGALQFGLAKPSGFLSLRKWGRFGVAYDASLFEEVCAAVAFVVVLFVTRGLYGVVPFFLAMALGAIAAWGTIIAIRLVTRRDVRWGSFGLKRAGAVTRAGKVACVVMAVAVLLLAQGALVRVYIRSAVAAWNRDDLAGSRTAIDAAAAVALVDWDEVDLPRATILLAQQDLVAARPCVERIVARDGRRTAWKVTLEELDGYRTRELIRSVAPSGPNPPD